MCTSFLESASIAQMAAPMVQCLPPSLFHSAAISYLNDLQTPRRFDSVARLDAPSIPAGFYFPPRSSDASHRSHRSLAEAQRGSRLASAHREICMSIRSAVAIRRLLKVGRELALHRALVSSSLAALPSPSKKTLSPITVHRITKFKVNGRMDIDM